MKKILLILVLYIVSTGNTTHAFDTKNIIKVFKEHGYIWIDLKGNEVIMLDFHKDNKKCDLEWNRLMKAMKVGD